MSAGDGYRYLLRTVAAGDGIRSLSTPLTRYYAEQGTPPGFWLGAAIGELGDGRLHPGDVVTETQLQLLLGMGRDPVDGAPLGRAYPVYASLQERIQRRVAELSPHLQDAARTTEIDRIESEERAAGTRRSVAGYDFTFSVPKSVSVLWAVADAPTQARILTVHHHAVQEVLDFMEREVAATRTGVTSTDGAVAQVQPSGLIAAAYDHYDSRAGDPHLHTHVVVSNKVKTVLDGRWRSLDGRPLFTAAVALSELHEGVVADLMTAEFGIGWSPRERGRDRNPAWDIAGVSSELLAEFSSRSRAIDREKDRLIDAYRAAHGRLPTSVTILRLRAQATLSTRPAKQLHSLAELTAQWRARARQVLRADPVAWTTRLTETGSPAVPVRVGDVRPARVAQLAAEVVTVVGERRSTWNRWNLHAEASRHLKGVRFASTADREAATALVAGAAEQASTRLTPAELTAVPVEFRRSDGSSEFRPRHSTLYSSAELLAAEDRLLERARRRTAPVAAARTVLQVCSVHREDRKAGVDQAAAVTAIMTSGRLLDVLVGPAGAGKTTTMALLRQVWELEHGAGSVVGLAPSAGAADVLASELGIRAENTAKWLHDARVGAAALHAGELVIIDEASLAGTRTLDAISRNAEAAGAKVLLVGDWAQLQAVEAGGAFALLVRDRVDAPTLADVHRFTHAWEARATLDLRDGRAEVIDTYLSHGRVRGGDTEHMFDMAYRAWRADLAAGQSSVLVAPTRDAVAALNERARADRVLAGEIDPRREVIVADAAAASIGDTVVTRRNDRSLRAGRSGWVRNGDRWTITKLHTGGEVTLQRLGYRRGAKVVVPAGYAADHLQLGYAVTGFGAQGITVDSSHAVVLPGTTREHLYVGLTRGRLANTAYVATDRPDDAHDQPHPGSDPDQTAARVLVGVLRNVGAESSAHEALTAEHDRWGSVAQLAAEYETIATAAQHERWAALVRSTSLTPADADAVIASDAFGALAAELRRAEAHHHDVDRLLPRLVDARDNSDAHDVAAVLRSRLVVATSRPADARRGRQPARLIVDLIPEAIGPMASPMLHALAERRELIEQRGTDLVHLALQYRAEWISALGPVPTTPADGQRWLRSARAVAAYRDRYAVTGDHPIGPAAGDDTQRRAHAGLAALIAQRAPADFFDEALKRARSTTRDTGLTSGLTR